MRGLGVAAVVAALMTTGLAATGVQAAPPTEYKCHGQVATVVGTTGDDVLTGTEGPDVITGRAGDDTILGLGGNDVICGGPGDDRVDAGAGDDQVWGATGDDRLVGGPGADFIRGNAGDDVIDGQEGSDRANGGSGHDQCWSAEFRKDCDNDLVPVPLPLNSYNIADLGVTDVDGDGALDVFGLNHNALDTVLRSTGDGGFADVSTALGLAQDRQFPGLEDRGTLPRLRKSGLHVLNVGKRIRLHAIGVPASGSLLLYGATRVREQVQATYQKSETSRPNGLVETRLTFSVSPGGYLVIDPYYLGGPVQATVTAPTNPALVHVGALGVHPASTTFGYELRDRHGAAWLGSDDPGTVQEAFVVGGGLRGDMALFEGVRSEEYLVDDGGQYADVATARGLVKDNCSSRQTAWVDVDADGRLDLYVACEFGQGNQLHRQDADGTFTDVADELELDLDDAGPFRWVDLDLDGASELVTATDAGVTVSVRQGDGGYVTSPVTGPVAGARTLSVADHDGDGDLDLLLAATGTSLLLRNEGGTLTAVTTASVGLPAAMLTATFVDEDDDGLTDVDASPGGLFRQGSDGRFSPVDLVPPDEGTAVDALTTWFDVDGDGDRDRLHGVLTQSPAVQHTWVTTLLENTRDGQHWLQVAPVGPPGNRSAIGALVTVGDHVEQVGASSEGSRFSQGHHRLYFGLGAATEADVSVRWPDGTVTTVTDVAADQVLRPAQP